MILGLVNCNVTRRVIEKSSLNFQFDSDWGSRDSDCRTYMYCVVWQTRLYWRPSVTPFNKCIHVMVSVTSRQAGCLSPPGTTSHSSSLPL